MITAQLMRNKKMMTVVFLFLSIFFTGCTSAISPEGYTNDPFESVNRKVYSFNKFADKAVLKPVSQAYDFVFPKPVKTAVSNFFGNIGDIGSLINAIFQLDGKATAGIAARVISNTFFGLGGLIDVATPMNNPKIKKNFGSTLAHYGVKSGPFLMLPFFGPSTLRDASGLVPDIYLSPITYTDNSTVEWSLAGTYAISKRASLLDLDKQLEGISTDPYATIRDVWLQKRWSDLGTPVDSQDDDYDSLFGAPSAAE